MFLSRTRCVKPLFGFARYLHSARPMRCEPPKRRVQLLKKLDTQLDKLPNLIRQPVIILVKTTIILAVLFWGLCGVCCVVGFMTGHPFPLVAYVFISSAIALLTIDLWF